jgi:mannose-6-phosphate isomerase-like protein (cupin superfamily)
MTGRDVSVRTLLPFENSGGGNVQVDCLTVAAGEVLPCRSYPEERLYYVEGGHGALSVYDKMTKGDTYILRPDIALYFTPGLPHEIVNTGRTPMQIIVFRVSGSLVPSGVPDGVLKWTGIGLSEAPGNGFWYTDIFNLQDNETAREGLHLQVWGIGLRRAQKITGAEVLALAPHSSTRRHVHSDTTETFYLISGEGHYVLEDARVPCKAADVCSVPPNIAHHTENTGDTPMLYVCISTLP